MLSDRAASPVVAVAVNWANIGGGWPLTSLLLFVICGALLGMLIQIRRRRGVSASGSLESPSPALGTASGSSPCLFYTWRLDASGNYYLSFLSPLSEDMLGVSPSAVHGSANPFLELVHRQDRPGLERRIAQSLKELSGIEETFRYCHPVKGEIWLRVWSMPAKQQDDSVLWHGCLIDFTKEKQFEEQHRKAENARKRLDQKFRSIWEKSLDGMRLTDPEGNVILVNEAYCKFVGKRREELEGHPFTAAYLTDDAERMIRRYKQRYQAGALEPLLERDHVFWDGRKVRFELSVSVIESMSGPAVLSIFRDVTRRKAAESALHAQTEMLRTLSQAIMQSPASIVITNAARNIAFVNPQFTLVTGFSPDEILGAPSHPLHGQDAGSDEEDAMWLAVSSGQVWRGEIPFRNNRGEMIWERVSLSALRDDKGAIANYVEVREDITEQKKADEELRKSRLAADAAARAKSEFLASMSHEIRTPLNGIIGMTGLLNETNLSGEQREYAQTIQSCSESLMRIVNDILDFSKIDAGRMQLRAADFDLMKTMEATLDVITPDAQRKGLNVLFWYDPAASRVYHGDSGRLAQIVLNLLSNAVKFTDKGHVLLELHCRKVEGGRARLRISVHDTGIGIPFEKQSMLFQKFTQLDGTNTRRYGGTGLGLVISQQLMRLMGGDIQVASMQGEGSSFHCELELPLASPIASGGQQPRPRSLLHVLVFHENQLAGEACANLCERAGLSVDTSGSREHALRLCRQASHAEHPFDVVIASTPAIGEPGATWLRQLRLAGGGQPLTIIGMLSAGEPVVEVEPADHSCDLYVRQTPRLDALLAALQSLMSETPPSNLKRMPAKAHTPSPLLAGKHVLLVEDNAMNQMLTESILVKFGCRVSSASNGKEAIQAAGQTDFDLVLMDCHMPEMDGFDATRALRQDPRLAALPIVALTAAARPADRAMCLESGMNDYLSKPIRGETLKAMLEKWFSDNPNN